MIDHFWKFFFKTREFFLTLVVFSVATVRSANMYLLGRNRTKIECRVNWKLELSIMGLIFILKDDLADLWDNYRSLVLKRFVEERFIKIVAFNGSILLQETLYPVVNLNSKNSQLLFELQACHLQLLTVIPLLLRFTYLTLEVDHLLGWNLRFKIV